MCFEKRQHIGMHPLASWTPSYLNGTALPLFIDHTPEAYWPVKSYIPYRISTGLPAEMAATWSLDRTLSELADQSRPENNSPGVDNLWR